MTPEEKSTLVERASKLRERFEHNLLEIDRSELKRQLRKLEGDGVADDMLDYRVAKLIEIEILRQLRAFQDELLKFLATEEFDSSFVTIVTTNIDLQSLSERLSSFYDEFHRLAAKTSEHRTSFTGTVPEGHFDDRIEFYFEMTALDRELHRTSEYLSEISSKLRAYRTQIWQFRGIVISIGILIAGAVTLIVSALS